MAYNFAKAKVHPKFLASNATSHIWAFSAIAELIDNAYDPEVCAKDLWIDKETISMKPCLVFRDNGKGMSMDKLTKMLSFGFCEKDKSETNYHKAVGRYGNGFKSGSMRLAKDALVLTVSQDCQTACVGMLSQSLCETWELDEVILPLLEYSLPDLQLIKSEDSITQANLEAVMETSPFHSKEDLNAELHKILDRKNNKLGSGTTIVLFNLKRIETKDKSNPYELVFPSQPAPSDDSHAGSHEQSSSQLDQEERSDVTHTPQNLRQKKLDPAFDIQIFSGVEPSQTPGTAAEEVPSSQESIATTSTRSSSSEGNLLNYKQSLRAYCSVLFLVHKMNIYIRGLRVQQRFMKTDLRNNKEYDFVSRDQQKKRVPCKVTFGLAPEWMEDYGVMFYHRNRLIKCFVKLKCQTKISKKFGCLVGEGVVGVVDVTDVLDPIHNKQDFAENNALYKSIMSTLSTKMEKYCEENNIGEVRSRPSRIRPNQNREMLQPQPGLSAANDVSETDEGQSSVIEAAAVLAPETLETEVQADVILDTLPNNSVPETQVSIPATPAGSETERLSDVETCPNGARETSPPRKRPRLGPKGDNSRESSPASSAGAEVRDILNARQAGRKVMPAAIEEATPSTSRGLRGQPAATHPRSAHAGSFKAVNIRGRRGTRGPAGAMGSGPKRANNSTTQARMLLNASDASTASDQHDEKESFRENVHTLLKYVEWQHQNMPPLDPIARVEESLRNTLKFLKLPCK